MSGIDVHNERHHQNSNTDSYDFELHQEKGEAESTGPKAETSEDAENDEPRAPPIPLHLILKAVPDILPYAGDDIRTWRDLVGAAHDVRGMMGISPDA